MNHDEPPRLTDEQQERADWARRMFVPVELEDDSELPEDPDYGF